MSTVVEKLSIENLYSSITTFSVEEKLQLVTKILNNLDYDELKGKKLSIKGLKGLSKELWQGEDAQEYVNKERNEWDTY